MKYLFLLILVVSASNLTFSQKVYNTRTGKISFFSSAPLEDIEAKNNAVTSQVNTANGQYNFELNIKDFHFENDLMEEHFNESYLHSDKFPKAYFKGFITNLKDISFSKDGIYNVTVKGSLTIHGVTRDIVQAGNIEIKGGKVIARSKFTVLRKDYNIGGSLASKMISDTVEITVNCQYD
ncbi:MAG: YceI family protein [Segetibacter sp.]|nr:YceI family protein [Segetibacter sp.]